MKVSNEVGFSEIGVLAKSVHVIAVINSFPKPHCSTELFKVVFVNEIWMYDSQLMFCQCCLEGRWLQALEQIGIWLLSCEYIFVLRLSFLKKWDSITFGLPGLFAYLNGMRIAISIKNDEVKAFSLWKVKHIACA